MTHIDLFSGIGGFALACAWNGIATEVFCERDERCQRFLKRTYPDVPIVPDIREFDGTKWRGRFLLTAGVPCQPASRAGKQRGKDDDRWLWPEALRVVSEARPDWVLFENPLGINDVGLDGILADLEGLDYEVSPPLIIPACAVNSPQLRNRYWIVGHSRCKPTWSEGQPEQSSGNFTGSIRADSQSHMVHSRPIRQEECQEQATGVEQSSQSHMADTEVEGSERYMGWGMGDGEIGRKESDGSASTHGQGYMADTAELRREGGGRLGNGERTRQEQSDSYISEGNDGNLEKSSESGRKESINIGGKTGPYSEFTRSGEINFWSSSVWLPCADNKVRRAPDDSFGVAHGLHRSVLAALGNSIVPQVAAEVIRAIVEAGDENGKPM